MATVYCEVPASRSTIVRTTVQSLVPGNETSCTLADNIVPACLCAMVAIITRSLTRNSDGEDDEGIRELQPLANIFGESLSKDVFCDLASALSSLPPSRSALLAVSQKYLQASFGGSLWWEMASASRGMQENRNRVDCALYGLCTLLARTNDERHQPWREVELESWAILSSIVVQNKPALHVSERTALFQRLSSFAKEARFSLETIGHLLRASLIRLLQFFDGDDEDYFKLVPERIFVSWGSRGTLSTSMSQREDVAGLLRFVMLLLEHLSLIDEKCRDRLWRGRGRVLRMLAAEGGQNDEENLLRMSNESDEYIYSHVACECIAAVLRSSMSSCDPAQTVNKGRRTKSDCRATERWRRRLISSEIEHLKCYGMTSDREKRLVWLTTSSIDTAVRRVTSCNVNTKHRFLSSLCDVVFDLIFRPLWSKSIVEDPTQRKQEMLAHALSLIHLKRRLARHSDGGIYFKESDVVELAFDASALCASAVEFLELCANFVSTSLAESISLDKLEDLILSLLSYCFAMKRLGCVEVGSDQDVDLPMKISIVTKLLTLYDAIGNETSSRNFLKYLEVQGVSEAQSSLGTKSSSRSFLLFESDEDLDRVVQLVRFCVLSTMSAWLKSLSDSIAQSSEIVSVETSTSLWVSNLRLFTMDLRAGLDGHSGGLTEDLYSTYLSLIESCCSLAVSQIALKENGVEYASEAFDHAVECAIILKEILCRFPLRAATHFRKTSMIAMSELPSMQRQAIIVLAASSTEDLPHTSTRFLIDVFYQVMSVSMRQQCLARSASWQEIAGPEHLSVPDEERISDGDKALSVDVQLSDLSANDVDRVPSVIVIPDASKTVQNDTADDHSELNEKKLQLPSKESLVWATCASLVSMDQILSESYSILNGNVIFAETFNMTPSLSWKRYCLEHSKVLADVFKACCSAMKRFDELNGVTEIENLSEENKNTILSATFSDAAKLRYCLLLERISTVILVAIRSVSHQLKKGGDTNDLVRAVSIACLSSWLSIDRNKNGLESLSKRWYQAEKQLNQATASTGGIQKGLGPALRRLPKFLVRMQDVEADLRTLYQVLGKVTQEGNSTQQKMLKSYESLLKSCTDNGVGQMASLRSMVKQTLKSLAKLDFVVGDPKQSPLEDSLLTRKRPRRSSTMKTDRRRRKVKRSRNQIVDNWLYLDDKYEMDDGFDDDAFVDLEDFLVDG